MNRKKLWIMNGQVAKLKLLQLLLRLLRGWRNLPIFST